MRKIHFSLLSLCALSLLSACGKDSDDRQNVAVSPIQNNEINLPGEDPQNIQMISAGLIEANQMRARRGLPQLAYDNNLTVEAQSRARGLNRPGDNFQRGNDQVPGNDFNSIQPPQRILDPRANNFGNNGQNQFNQNQFGQNQWHHNQGPYVAENVTYGLRSARQAFIQFAREGRFSQNLFSVQFRRHGLGYFQGRWVHLLAN